jgi:hypothetical protein
MRGRFVAGACYQLLDKEELRLGSSGNAQILQYGEAILVSPVVEHLADEEDRDVFLLRRLRIKETVALGTKCQCVLQGYWSEKSYKPWSFTRPDSRASGMFFQYCREKFCEVHVCKERGSA